MLRLATKAVAGAAHSLDRVAPERAVDLLSEVANVHVDDVRAVFVRVVPAVLEEVEAREHLARPAHERLEQRELLARERDLDVAPPGAPRRGVEAQIAVLEDCRTLERRAP